MPEASIHKHACPVFQQRQVRVSRQSRGVQPVAESPESIHIISVPQSVPLSCNTPHQRVYTSVPALAAQEYTLAPFDLCQQTILPLYAHFCHRAAPAHKCRKPPLPQCHSETAAQPSGAVTCHDTPAETTPYSPR